MHVYQCLSGKKNLNMHACTDYALFFIGTKKKPQQHTEFVFSV